MEKTKEYRYLTKHALTGIIVKVENTYSVRRGFYKKEFIDAEFWHETHLEAKKHALDMCVCEISRLEEMGFFVTAG